MPDSLREAALALGRPALARHAAGRPAHRRARHRHRRHAGRGAGGRRDRAAALHRVQQPVLADAASTGPIASLPVQIFTYAISPYEDWHRQAWAAALVLVALVLVLNLAARLLVRHRTDAR